MSEYVDPIWIQKQIEKDELRLINLKAGHYYISRKAEIYSMNRAQPRQIQPIPKVNGEKIIVLYTPSITAYDVPSLVLNTFNPSKSQKASTESQLLVPCFRDADPSNCSLTNLYWGDDSEALKWRKVAMQRLTLMQREQSDLEKEQQVATEMEVTPVPSMVERTEVLSALINMIIDTSQRMVSNNRYDDETQFLLRMVILRFKHVSTQEFVPLENLRSVFEVEAPDPKIGIMMKRFHERFDKIAMVDKQ